MKKGRKLIGVDPGSPSGDKHVVVEARVTTIGYEIESITVDGEIRALRAKR